MNTDKRKIFFQELIKLAESDPAIVLIVPDVGFSFTDEFQQKYPTRYYNFGVTEQSCMLIAAGMALSGLKPYVYSMINFVAKRPFEMIRNGIALHHANVKILGVKGSEKYKFLGFSHNMVFDDEDVYHLKPYLDCYVPTTEEETANLIQTTYESNKPCYIRL
jgi:transketolase